MADLSFKGVEIIGIASAVPENIHDNRELTSLLPEDELEKVISNIGVRQRRIASKSTTSVDLCIAAAKHLLSEMKVEKDEINMVDPSGGPYLTEGMVIKELSTMYHISVSFCSFTSITE